MTAEEIERLGDGGDHPLPLVSGDLGIFGVDPDDLGWHGRLEEEVRLADKHSAREDVLFRLLVVQSADLPAVVDEPKKGILLVDERIGRILIGKLAEDVVLIVRGLFVSFERERDHYLLEGFFLLLLLGAARGDSAGAR